MNATRFPAVVTFVASSLMLAASPLHAVVTTIDGQVQSEVKELVGGSVVNSDFAFKDLNDTTSTLPLVATAELTRTEGSDTTAGARSVTTFSDPRLSTLPDPNEFAVDLAAVSDQAGVSYTGNSTATETRSITFLSNEIQADDGTDLLAESQFFVDGIILLWGQAGQTGVQGTTASINFKVDQSGGSLASPATALNAALSLTGQADGSAVLAATGGLEAGNVIQLNLTGQVQNLGPLHVIIIPDMAIPYQYNAKVGEAFTLKAVVKSDVAAAPQTGAAVVLGVPLLELASLINQVTGADTGTLLQTLVNARVASSGSPDKPLVLKAEGTTVTVLQGGVTPPPFCGIFGMESVLAAAGLGVVSLARRRR